ncbi:HD domain-containing protein [Streptomyces sp. NPDC060243]|uniref:HD domain-containing protein n=1 Tax=Streptomyces sp. NPDC060243 TaxID=3347081 RepID=UPI00365BA986
MSLTKWAHDLAESVLAEALPRRWAHVQGVARRARELRPILSESDADLLESAAFLHDIGYAPKLVDTGFHPLDGARFLRRQEHADERVVNLVAHHSCALLEAEERGCFVRPDHDGAVRRTDSRFWKPALVAAGVIPEPNSGERHQAAREHGMHALRHFYASVLLDAGENIKALSTYLGHTDPGFTLRVYTHLMPASDGRSRKAVDTMYEAPKANFGGPLKS